jgi:hypothetical protein
MKKILFSLAALATLSTGAFASYRDVTTATGNNDVAAYEYWHGTAPSAGVEALAVPTGANNQVITPFERMILNSEDPGSSRH